MNFYKKKVFKNLSCLWFFHLQDFYVADASENQVFLAVAHSARTTHLYISDTSGTKYSLSMERVLYFSQNTTSAWLRWQMITLHIYFFKKTEMVLFTFNLYSNKHLRRLSPPSLSNITVLPSSMTRLAYTYRSVLNHCDVVPSSFLPLFLSSCA